MSKVVVIGDVHGRGIWKQIIAHESDADLFIFLGDYVSSHDGISGQEQLDNLKEILAYKEEHPDKVILLRGNHDMQHLGYYWAECSGYFRDVGREMGKPELKERYLLDTQWIYIYKDIVFSHAGVSKRWFDDSGVCFLNEINNLEPSELFGFRPCKMSDYYGISETQGPTWIRPQTLIEYAIPEWRQVVGHTPVKHIVNLKDEIKRQFDDPMEVGISIDIDKCTDIWLCDCLPHEYLVIEDEEFVVRKTKDFNIL